MRDPSRFWDRLAKRYARTPISDQASYEKKLEITRRYLTPESDVLEFGCGTGSTALLHAPHVRHVLATDFSAAMVEIAQQKARDQGIDNVTFAQSAVETFQAQQSYDVVLCLSLFHLLGDRRAAMARIFELLRPGGVLVSSTVCLGDSMGYFRYIAPLGRAVGLLPLVKVFTRDVLADDFRSVGFELDYQWHPGRSKAVFMVVKKP